MTTATTDNLHEIIQLIPGYNPYDQAGDCVFEASTAQMVIDFVQECCTHVKTELGGSPLILEPWQKAIFANLWGWKQPDGRRRYREALIYVARGNSKTTMAAAMICVSLFLSLDDDAGAELYSGASTRKQAAYCLEIVQGMIKNESEMDARATLYKHSVLVGDKSYQAVSAEAGGAHSLSPSVFVNDELHVQLTPAFTEAMMTGGIKRSHPLTIHLTTADFEREGSICNTKHDYACRVRDNGGKPDRSGYDPGFLPVVYEAKKTDDWQDPEVWKKANPNLGVSVSREYLEREIERAKDDPSVLNSIKRDHLNIRTQAATAWIHLNKWDECEYPIRIDDYTGQPCFVGLDIASIEDFTACVFAFKNDAGGADVFSYFWVPEPTACRRGRERKIPYESWSEGGFLKLTTEDVLDANMLVSDILGLVDKYKLNVREMAVDRAWQGNPIICELVKRGVFAFAHEQGAKGMIPPTKSTKTAILGGTLRHPVDPVLRWMIGNVVVVGETDYEYPVKHKSSDKIDGAVAMIMAVGRALAPNARGDSPYNRRGILKI